VVKRYVEEGDQIRFEKFGGWIGIPTYEVLRIVPDEPDADPNLPRPPTPGPAEGASAGSGPPAELHVALRGGASVRATAVAATGDVVRVSVADGAFTVHRSDVVGVVRMPAGTDTPEAWLSVTTGEGRIAESAGRAPGAGLTAVERLLAGARPPPPPPAPSSDRPHLLRLANGQVMRVERFWIEDGQISFLRLGGLIGIALTEVARLMPEEPASMHGRTPVRYGRQLGPGRLEVRVRSGTQRVRLIGIEPVTGAESPASPWPHLERGLVLHLEFDRQRYDPDGDWLAYVFLPSGRMLNAELIRLGLARPRPDGKNLRYVDLFHEIAQVDGRDPPGSIEGAPRPK
jgi:hypothetical protein